MLTEVNTPAVITQDEEGRIKLRFTNTRNGNLAISAQGEEAGGKEIIDPAELVGLVDNIRQDPTTVVAPPIVYLPLAQTTTYSVSLVLGAETPITNADVMLRLAALD